MNAAGLNAWFAGLAYEGLSSLVLAFVSPACVSLSSSSSVIATEPVKALAGYHDNRRHGLTYSRDAVIACPDFRLVYITVLVSPERTAVVASDRAVDY